MPKKTNKPKKNPSDPTLLALEVFEAAIREPLASPKAKPVKPLPKKKEKK